VGLTTRVILNSLYIVLIILIIYNALKIECITLNQRHGEFNRWPVIEQLKRIKMGVLSLDLTSRKKEHVRCNLGVVPDSWSGRSEASRSKRKSETKFSKKMGGRGIEVVVLESRSVYKANSTYAICRKLQSRQI